MARETKVGLIVGLGVILFVGIFVSDYLSVPDLGEGVVPEDFGNFNGQTTNQPQQDVQRASSDTPFVRRSQTDENYAAVALENIERSSRPPTAPAGRDPRVVVPPFRDEGPLVGTSDLAPGMYNQTPPAIPNEPGRAVPPSPQPPINPGSSEVALSPDSSAQRLGPGATDPLRDTHVGAPPEITPQPQPRRVEHVVGKDETLSAIARKYYDGDDNMWRSIRDANPGKVGTNGEVRQGTTLIIPRRSLEAAGQVAEGDVESPAVGQRVGNNAQGQPARRRVTIVVVKERETLSDLALEHLGSASRWRELLDANADVLDKPENLRVGMKLKVPTERTLEVIEQANAALSGQGNAAREQPAEQPRETAPAGGGRTYTVKSNDSLYRIAEQLLGNGERYKEIYEANRDQLASPDAIAVGMVLKMPAR